MVVLTLVEKKNLLYLGFSADISKTFLPISNLNNNELSIHFKLIPFCLTITHLNSSVSGLGLVIHK